ncbi:hypothetical protein B0H17DRAFT_1103038 [Mycena rosella]|uniref:Uncharacterized protein n=1 Tax=Mycena rosella TaxID=1033263 RepID=A0AAD7G017_MYCRO|nr:hypothetical protein B0H17DRAFT_1103038 [Mycena rosella]
MCPSKKSLANKGIQAEGELRRTTALSGEEKEELLQYHLSRKKAPDGGELQFGNGWNMKEIDGWMRDLLPEMFGYLDVTYGSDGYHWVLVKKDRFTVFTMKRETFTSDDLAEAKGSAARGWRECAV